MHLYLADHFDSLQNLLHTQANATKFDTETPKDLNGINIWMIYVVGHKKREKAMNALKKCPLNFNSYVFECFKPVKGISNKLVF